MPRDTFFAGRSGATRRIGDFNERRAKVRDQHVMENALSAAPVDRLVGPLVEQLGLEGHDSELFSFLDPTFIEQLRKHPAADKPLWCFGEARDEKLISVPMWNTNPGSFAWTIEPTVTKRADDHSVNYRGFLADSDLIQVRSLILIRYLFVHSYTCALDDRRWISERADPTLERLGFIRGQFGRSKSSPEWMELQAGYFDWCLSALERIVCRPTTS